jgi:LPS-assembly lipoprotein
MQTAFKWLFITALITILTACGFKLRGFADGSGMPFSSVFVSGGGGTSGALQRQIKAFGETMQAKNPQEADVRLTILGESVNRQLLTVNSAGRVSEYRVYLRVGYRVQYGDRVLLEQGRLQLFRDYSYNDSEVLGKESEQGMLTKDMYQDAANQILRRAAALVKNAKLHPEDASAPALEDD